MSGHTSVSGGSGADGCVCDERQAGGGAASCQAGLPLLQRLSVCADDDRGTAGVVGLSHTWEPGLTMTTQSSLGDQ